MSGLDETDGHALSLGAWAHENNTAPFMAGRKLQLPMAHTPDVDVHEVRAAIVPHSSAMQTKSSVAQLRRQNPG